MGPSGAKRGQAGPIFNRFGADCRELPRPLVSGKVSGKCGGRKSKEAGLRNKKLLRRQTKVVLSRWQSRARPRLPSPGTCGTTTPVQPVGKSDGST
eukprot:9453-Pyramimonas_sp.AAC.1